MIPPLPPPELANTPPYIMSNALYLKAVLPQFIRRLGVLALVLGISAKFEEQGHDGVQMSSKPVPDGTADRADCLCVKNRKRIQKRI